jgi:hypothetical protein
MPTGYTARIGEGATFEEFVWECARAFGANVEMRDEPSSVPVREYAPSRYHIESLEKAMRRVEAAADMDLAVAELRARADYDSALHRWREAAAHKKQLRAKYEAVMAKVQAWEPPTPEHVDLKRFMTEQIGTSIDFDCHAYPEPVRESAAEWLTRERESAARDVEYHQRGLAEEALRVERSNRWNRELANSVPPPWAKAVP